ncbi:MAG: glycosyltransferase family 2 protein [Candidatus Synoicihabitans palmerolidicus]|nr:glycosyltransferase family 2 protein [Candidatus Synoicihabitans palmerolidicus]
MIDSPYGISVVIPTRNRSTRLPPVLEAVRQQESMDTRRWEIIVADNDSDDETVAVVEKIGRLWQADGGPPLSLVGASQRGAHHARCAGLAAARGRWVAFLDDDNVPDKNWLEQALTGDTDHGLGAVSRASFLRVSSSPWNRNRQYRRQRFRRKKYDGSLRLRSTMLRASPPRPVWSCGARFGWRRSLTIFR